MKILLSLTVAATILAGTANAQHASFGIKGGLNVSNIHNSNNVNYDPVVGLHVGILTHIHLNKSLALQPELVYSTEGAKYKTTGSESTINLGYLNIPVLLQYMFQKGFRLQAGPQLGFLVNANQKTGSVKKDIKNDLNTVDVALAVGAGYLVPGTGFGFDARYNLGLTDINKNSSVSSKNRGAQIGVFYLFHK